MKCTCCARENVFPLMYMPTKVSIITRKTQYCDWLCPQCFAEKNGIIIPTSLTKNLLGNHYIRLGKCSKQPLDLDWPNHPMKPDDPVLTRHLAGGGNYGVVAGNGLVILDADSVEIKRSIKEHLPETFTVQSPGSNGWHCYYFSELSRAIRLYDVVEGKERRNVGDVQGKGKMCVGPGSFHPNGWQYKVLEDLPFAHVSEEELREALAPWLIVENGEVKSLSRRSRRERDLLDISVLDVIPLTGLRRRGDEYYGPHPVHGSTTGQNFWVNLSKNVFFCFRHNVGGGALTWMAIEEGIIDCAEAGRGALRGEVFKQVLEVAEKRGFKVPNYLGKEFGGTSVIIEGVKVKMPSSNVKYVKV